MKAEKLYVFVVSTTRADECDTTHGIEVEVQAGLACDDEAEAERFWRTSLDEVGASLSLEVSGHESEEAARAALDALLVFVAPQVREVVLDALKGGGGCREVAL